MISSWLHIAYQASRNTQYHRRSLCAKRNANNQAHTYRLNIGSCIVSSVVLISAAIRTCSIVILRSRTIQPYVSSTPFCFCCVSANCYYLSTTQQYLLMCRFCLQIVYMSNCYLRNIDVLNQQSFFHLTFKPVFNNCPFGVS